MLRAGFIGFGRMGITHFSIINTHPLVKIVSVCDQSKTMLSILDKYLDVEIYSNYQEMIDRCDLDFVVISTPADSHSNIIQYALEKNLHIFCEKPFVLDTVAGSKILDIVARKAFVNQVGYVNRFNKIFIEVKKLLESGLIGEIRHFNSEMYGSTVLKDTKRTWRGKRDTGGGCMNEFASHCIDLVTYLIGVPDRIVGSIMQSIYSTKVEDLVSSTFIYNEGFSGRIEVNWSDQSIRRPMNIITILGTRGKIIADRHAYKIYLKEKHSRDGLQEGWNTRYITDLGDNVRFYVRGNEFTRQLDYFIDCIEKNTVDNLSSFAEAFKTDMIMQQIVADTNAVDTQVHTVNFKTHKHSASGWKFWRRAPRRR
jgi:predicted dehydrogenase